MRIVIMVMTFWAISMAAKVPARGQTAITYQGQLKDGGAPANGYYDMSFSLFNAASEGATIAGPLVFNAGPGNEPSVEVTNGLFSVTLDFGDVYDGTALWLQLDLRLQGVGAYTPLVPRQPLTATPFAIYALSGPGGSSDSFWNAVGNHIRSSNSGNVGVGTTPSYKLHVRESVAPGIGQPSATMGLHWSQASVPTFEDWLSFRVGGTALVPLGHEGTHVIRKSTENLHFSVEQNRNSGTPTPQMTISPEGHIGVGTTDPASSLHIFHPGTSTGEVQISSPGGHPGVIGNANNGNRRDIRFTDTGLGLYARNSPSAPSSGNGMFIAESGYVGIGNATPAARLQVTGGTDSAPAGGGFMVTGDLSGANVSIDDNEIMARNNGTTSALYLNNNGGDVVVGGAIDIGYEIVTANDSSIAIANCPSGKKVIGGGCQDVDGSDEVVRSYPTSNGTGWYCQVTVLEPARAYAICAKVK